MNPASNGKSPTSSGHQKRWSIALNSVRRRSSLSKTYMHRVGLNVSMITDHSLLHRVPVKPNDALVNSGHFPTNKIKTSKYTKVGFLPKNLYEQFRRVANWFFLGVTILQFFPQFYTIEPIVAALPFIIVLAGTALKDGFEDYKRHAADNETNQQKVYILSNWENVNRAFTVRVEHWYDKPSDLLNRVIDFLFLAIKLLVKGVVLLYKTLFKRAQRIRSRNSSANSSRRSLGQIHAAHQGEDTARKPKDGQSAANNLSMHDGTTSALAYLNNDTANGPKWSQTNWEDVIVGDIVLLKNNESIPADIVLLSSSEPECVCFVETKNLDGETNLKIRRGVTETSWLRSPYDCAELVLTVDCEKAHNNLYVFSGVVNLPQQPCIKVHQHHGAMHNQHLEESQAFTKLGRSASTDLKLSSNAQALLSETKTNDRVPVVGSHQDLSLPVFSPLSPLINVFSAAKQSDNGSTSASVDQEVSQLNQPPTPTETSATAAVASQSANASRYSPRTSVASSAINFHSAFASESADGEMQKLPLNINNLLLRGCILRNTEWALGLVVYTGKDTKVILNSGATPSKRSKLDVQANPQILLNLLVLLILCIVCAIGGPIWSHDHNGQSTPYIWDTSTQSSYTGVVAFFNAVISFQSIVPISFYISIELIKLVQALFIHFDIDMYYEPIDRRCMPRAYNLSDDLGRIEYVFSDKTGTLTRNVMEFKKCSIGGMCYLSDNDPNGMVPRHVKESSFDVFGTVPSIGHPGRGFSFAHSTHNRSLSNDGFQNMPLFQAQLQSEPFDSTQDVLVGRATSTGINGANGANGAGNTANVTTPRQDTGPAVEALDESENKYIKNLEDVPYYSSNLIAHAKGSDEPAQFIGEFFRILSVCHSVLVSKVDPEFDPYLLRYKAQSPDEAALVDAARATGFVFTGRDLHGVTVDVFGKQETYQLLNMIEFNSSRKRMSVIVRKPDGQICLYCKGADTVVFERLRPGQQVMIDITNKHLEEFAREGLRTLCLAYSVLEEEQYYRWNLRFQEASMSLNDREALMDACAEEIEQNLVFVGATAIEDKLQDGVPEAIQILSRAGMKLWVLTGDKLETAVNIGYSCNLLTENMNLIVVKDENSFDQSRSVSQQKSRDLTLLHLRQAIDQFFPDAPIDVIVSPFKERAKLFIWGLFARLVGFFKFRSANKQSKKPAVSLSEIPSGVDNGVGRSSAVDVASSTDAADHTRESANGETHELKERKVGVKTKSILAGSASSSANSSTNQLVTESVVSPSRNTGLPKIQTDLLTSPWSGGKPPQTGRSTHELPSANGANDNASASAGRLPPIVETPTSSRFDLHFFKEKKAEKKKKKNAAPIDPRLLTHALVIDGACLKHALETTEGQELLLRLAGQCKAVLCCRVSPLQKAQVVELVKQRKRAMCLAIGDGANDVSMIQAAHVGVGIAGEEGLQAVMASDYAFAQFRFLAKLILVQGRWAFKRNSRLILNFFFKNLIWTMPFFYYQFYSGFTMTYVIDYTYQLLYQTVFSSTAIIVMGWFDRELDVYYLFGIPGTYAEGIAGTAFSLKLFWCYMLDAAYQSLVIFFVSLGIYDQASPFSNGRQPDMIHLGTLMAIAGICNANFAVGLDTNQWTVPQVVLTFVPALLAFIWLIVFTSGLFLPNGADMRGVYQEMLGSGSFWLGLLLITALCMLPRALVKFGMRLLRPTDTDIVQEIQKYKIPIRGELYGENVLVSQRPASGRVSLASARSEMTMTVMGTGEVKVNRGFAFSQDAGTRDLLMGRSKKAEGGHGKAGGNASRRIRIWTPELQKLKLGVSKSMNIVKKVSYGGLSLNKEAEQSVAAPTLEQPSDAAAIKGSRPKSSSSSKVHLPFTKHHHASNRSDGNPPASVSTAASPLIPQVLTSSLEAKEGENLILSSPSSSSSNQSSPNDRV